MNKIEIPDRNLTVDEFEGFVRKAYNSSAWYLDRYNACSYQVRERLYRRGWPRNYVSVMDEDRNIVDEAMKKLEENKLLYDEEFFDGIINRANNGSRGKNYYRKKLRGWHVPEDVINTILNELSDDDYDDNMLNQVEKIRRGYYWQKETSPYKREAKIVRTLTNRGYELNQILSWIDNNRSLIHED